MGCSIINYKPTMLGYPHFRKPPFGMIPNDEYLQGFEITQGGDRLFGKMK